MAAQRIPNIDSFSDSLVQVIRGARTHLSTDQVDSAEFWCLRGDFQIDSQGTPPSLFSVHRTGMGRPRCIITRTQIRMLRDEGFRWADVARILGVSPINLRRRRTELEMPVGDNYDDIPEIVLENLVSEILHVTSLKSVCMTLSGVVG